MSDLYSEMVDHKPWNGSQDYGVDTTWRFGSEVIQVRIKRDAYAQQSFGRVSVLSAAREWTVLATAAPHELAELPGPYGSFDRAAPPLAKLAASLRDRARAILGV